uniref:Uncharacterized protein n=1 Tax=viral metagenome TaxID=1070528 RepID=A0A6M3MIP4_9ZZZZ
MDENMEKVRVKIDSYDDRCAMVLALANAGYLVTVEAVRKSFCETEYHVVFEYENY